MAKAITIVRGDDTNWRGIDFITVNINAPMLDLSTFKAVFVLANITKNFNDISSGSFTLNFSAQETANLPTTCYGALRLIDSSNRIATLETVIPFNVISQVHGNAIATEPYTITFDVTQGDEYILDFEVKVGGGGSGAVDSVNGKTGVVVLNASDVGAQETLISGTNIKTINNQSLLGSGNINISGGGGSTPIVDNTTLEFVDSSSVTVEDKELIFS